MPDIGAFYTATLKRQIMPQINDAIITRSAILQFLKSKGCMEFGLGGDGFQYRVRNSESSIGGATTDWGTRNFQTTQPFTAINDQYRQYSWPLTVSLFQMQRNENAGPEAKMFKMQAEQINEIRQAATTRISRHAYTGTGTSFTGDNGTPINGLTDIVSASNTYMSIDRTQTANAYFRAQTDTVATFTADANSIGVNDGVNSMEKMFLSTSLGKQVGNNVPDSVATEKDVPDGVLTTADIWRAFWASLQPQFRYTGDGADPAKFVKFNGIDVTWDNLCPSGKMWFLNSRHLAFDVVGSELLTILIERDEANPPVHVYMLGGQYQFYSTNPRYLGLLNVTAI